MGTSSQLDSSVAAKFLLGFEGTSLPAELRVLLAHGLGGVAIFHRNFSSLEGLCSLTREILRAAERPVLISMDQEGGTKFSLPEPFTQWPSPAELGQLNDAELVGRVARSMARELRAAGVNLNFAPMLDLHTNPASPVTTQRSFGADPRKVARLGAAFIRGLASEGVLACAKHYPGHGDAAIDPHEDLPVFHGDIERLSHIELVPFAEAIQVGVPTIMTAHILLPLIDPERPASLSRKMLADTLRDQMGFGGIILADDLRMGAVAKRFAVGDAAIETFRAGSDIALLCHDWSVVHPAMRAVAQARGTGRFKEGEWQASQERIEKLRVAIASNSSDAPALDLIGCAEHRALAKEIHARIAQLEGE